MPLVKRLVEPSELCRSLNPSVSSELTYVTNKTLSGVILQLSSLSLHAEDIFAELYTEASSFYNRASVLQDRIDKLSLKVTQLDATVEEVSIHDINKKASFKSNCETDQQIVSRESLPKMLHEVYNKADKPPPLQELNQYRDDGKDALKIYTDPDYFFNLWRDALQKEIRDAKEKRREMRKKEKRDKPNHRGARKIREAVATRKIEAKKKQMGKEFETETMMKDQEKYENIKHQQQQQQQSMSTQQQHQQHQQQEVEHQQYNQHPADQSHDADLPLPPMIDSYNPPPPPPVYNQQPIENIPPPPPVNIPAPLPIDIPPPPPVGIPTAPSLPSSIPLPPPLPSTIPPPPPVNHVPANVPAGIPPPPPPPVPTSNDQSVSSGGSGGLADALMKVSLKKAPPKVVAEPDGRNGLLQAIRHGTALKKVTKEEKPIDKPNAPGGANDVASILARRIAIDFSDSDSDSYDSDSDWDD